MEVTEGEMQSTKRSENYGWPQRDSSEHEGYPLKREIAGALIWRRITENNITNADKPTDGLLERIMVEVLSRSIKDGRVILLIHKYFRAGAVWMGRWENTEIGVPQGGPFSPLCANVILSEFDHKLERRGHKFVWYVDSIVIFCKSKASVEQTQAHIIPYIEKKLFLKVNREKTVMAYAGKTQNVLFTMDITDRS